MRGCVEREEQWILDGGIVLSRIVAVEGECIVTDDKRGVDESESGL